jgi:FAD/FMN-containing dehydrogenase
MAGVTLNEVMRVFAPRGFFPPVTPGTRHITLGGAVANDVHGKNHRSQGTFGRHVTGMTLLRSDRGQVEIGPEREAELFAATIGGLGLTGVILAVSFKLQRIDSTDLLVESLACANLDELCDAIAASGSVEHVASWIDCNAGGEYLGRGLLTRADWARCGPLEAHAEKALPWPTDRLGALLNPVTLKAFNTLLFAKGLMSNGLARQPYAKVFHPLDGIRDWNRLYGRAGFHQHQCVIPKAAGREPLRAMLRAISQSGEGSFLAVLKAFGGLKSPGLMSFPEEGLTLALDFRARGAPTTRLFERLDAIVSESGGRLYPAKDSRMSAGLFAQGYPELGRFTAALDPACLSDFKTRMQF